MKYGMLLAALLWAGPLMAEQQVIWLSTEFRPVESEADAERKVDDWEAVEEGYRVVIRMMDGAPALETTVNSLDFSDNVFVGHYRSYSEEGHLREEGYRNAQGHFHGHITGYYPDGSVRFESTLVDGKRHGPSINYHRNGTIENEMLFEHGVTADGWCSHFSSTGELVSYHRYQDGKLNGPSYRYRDGYKHLEQEYVDGQLHGVQRGYFADGRLRSETHYREGRRHGVSRTWNAEGQLTAEQNYHEHRNHGASVAYFDDGQLRSRSNWQHGNRIGEQEQFHQNGNRSRYERYDDEHRMVEQRQYGRDGRLQRRQLREYDDGGMVSTVERFHDDGSVQSRHRQAEDNSWSLREEFDEEGELTSRQEWLDNRRTGAYLSTAWDGSYERAGFVGGQYHGDYERVAADGEVLTAGRYDHGARVGEWRRQDAYGVITETYDEQGRLQGERRHVRTDGQLYELAHYLDGEKHGPFERRNEAGDVTVRGQYEHGKRQGHWLVQEGWSSSELSYGEMRDDVQVGEWRVYTRGGQLVELVRFDDQGRLHGRDYRFDRSGALLFMGAHRHGVAHGDHWQFIDGMPYVRSRYEDGDLIGNDYARDLPREEWPR